MKVDILAFGAHPDDVELSCGATLIKCLAEGKKAAIIDLTQGELGTRGSKTIRAKEAKAAADILGVSARENLYLEDGFFQKNQENLLKLIQIIRKFRPQWVFCNAPQDRHPDHGRAAQLVTEACFLSGLIKIETQSAEGNKQEEWRPKHIWHYIQWEELKPEFVVNVSGYEKQKLEAVKAYKSQFYDPGSEEKETPITSQNFLESIEYRMKNLGRLVGVDYAEGFIAQGIPCIDSIENFS